MKMLIGRRFDDPDVQQELAKQPYKTVKMTHGGVGVEVSYNNDPVVVPVEHFLAMMLVKAKEISAKASSGVNLADSVLAVPHWFTDSQRRALLHASEIAQLNCLKVANESTNIGLSYGIFKSAKKLFSETDPVHIMFIDIGYTGYSVSVVDFVQENMRVKASYCDRSVSGRAFDDAIIEFLAETFQKKTGINVRGNKKAVLKLQAAAEKAKKTLSPHGVNEASVSVECLAEDIDLSVILTRDEFESRVAPIVQRLRAPVERALREAGLVREQISETEIVGGSSRVSIVKRVLGEVLGLDASAMNYGLKTTMNADEAVARGGALQCALLSSRMKVKPFSVVDQVYYGIVASFDNSAGDVTEQGEEKVRGSSVPLYQRGDELPHKPRRITFRNKSQDFSITCAYDNESAELLPPGESRVIGKFTIKIPANTPPSDVRVTFNLDKHSLLHVQTAQLMQEVAAGEDSKEGEGKAAEGKEAENKEGGEEVEGKGKRFRKVDLEVLHECPGLTREQIKACLEQEASMALEDKLIIETADKRNELEAYIYAMRDKLDGSLRDFASTDEKTRLRGLMDQAEDWLYNDGFDAAKLQYAKKIEELQAIGNPIEQRQHEQTNRPPALEQLKKQLDMCKSFAANYDAAHEHINEEERERIRKEVQGAEAWVTEMQAKQNALPQSANAVLTVEGINAKRKAIFNSTNPIMIKPKPTPPPAPTTEEKKAEEKREEVKGEGHEAPMDQAKGGPESDGQQSK
ncbi:hypothetical protein EON64_07870 [archaeon]|nr:MAG: hypothetical protein EON64_07870 [archaeon]